MSTRATYEFVDQYDSFTVYKHHDGYPKGAVAWITNALQYAWPLPRFEADEFAAAFVAANKPNTDGLSHGGGIRLTADRHAHQDTEHHYIIKIRDGGLIVTHENLNRWSDDDPEVTTETLEEMQARYPSHEDWL